MEEWRGSLQQLWELDRFWLVVRRRIDRADALVQLREVLEEHQEARRII